MDLSFGIEKGVAGMKDFLVRLGRTRPSPALAVACVTLLVVLSGTSYAVTRPTGPTTLAELKGYEIKTFTGAHNSTASRTLAVTCSTGKKVVGGGFNIQADNLTGNNIRVVYSIPKQSTQNQWEVYAVEDAPYAGNWHVIAYAVCLKD
jgi:hypothetical protein